MLSIDAIEQTILELEAKDTTFSNCERLAPLYIVRDHLKKYEEASPKSAIEISADSEFLKAVNGRNPDEVWKIIDNHMLELKMLYPKTYNGILQAISKI